MEKILPKMKKRQGSVTVNLNDPRVHEEYVKIASVFSDQVSKRIEEGRRKTLKAEKKVKDIILTY
jgi:hypothetical protein